MAIPNSENDNALTGTGTVATTTPKTEPPPSSASVVGAGNASAHTACPAPAPSIAASGDPQLRTFQRAYLLQQVMEAPEHQLAKGKANRFPRAAARELSISPTLANEMREELVQEGHLRPQKKSGSIVYELTEQGKALLGTLPQKPVPEGRKPTREMPVTHEVQMARKTFLLFQLFEAEGQTLDQKQANRFREPGRKFLDLRASTANRLRKEMAVQGLIAMQKDGRNATYQLTDRGIEFLGVSGSFPETEFAVHGKILNLLLEAVRESAKQFEESETPESAAVPAAVN